MNNNQEKMKEKNRKGAGSGTRRQLLSEGPRAKENGIRKGPRPRCSRKKRKRRKDGTSTVLYGKNHLKQNRKENKEEEKKLYTSYQHQAIAGPWISCIQCSHTAIFLVTGFEADFTENHQKTLARDAIECKRAVFCLGGAVGAF